MAAGAPSRSTISKSVVCSDLGCRTPRWHVTHSTRIVGSARDGTFGSSVPLISSVIFSIARAFSLAGFSSDAKSTPSRETPSPPAWQFWQRTSSANENSRIRWISASRVMSAGKYCRFLPFHGSAPCWAAADVASASTAMIVSSR
jgi:hypothetical protein